MRRGELYRVRRPPGDPKPARVFVIVSRQALIDSTYSTVVCAPVFTHWHGLPTQVSVNTAEGLKHESAIQCDGLMSLEKSRLTDKGASFIAPHTYLGCSMAAVREAPPHHPNHARRAALSHVNYFDRPHCLA